MRSAALSPSELRAAVLDYMGFNDYSEYLAGDLWYGIRKRLFWRRANPRGYVYCFGCATGLTELNFQVHHTSYDYSTMHGDDDTALIILCRTCHEDIHFQGEESQVALFEANSNLFRLHHHNEARLFSDFLARGRSA